MTYKKPFNAHQQELILNGELGKIARVPAQMHLAQKKAIKKMGKMGETYIIGNAGAGITYSQNKQALDAIHILPQIARDVSEIDMSTELFGSSLDTPILLAPIGVLTLAHRLGDKAVAQAAEATNTPYVFSSAATYPMEELAKQMPNTPHWFQLYTTKIDELNFSLIQRAEQCGCSAIVVTLDTKYFGWRPHDLDSGFYPFITGQGLIQYFSDPVFQKLLDENYHEKFPKKEVSKNLHAIYTLYKLAKNYPGNTFSNFFNTRARNAITLISNIMDPSVDWERLKKIKSATRLPVILKGVLTVEDAKNAVEIGLDGIVVSNHGGRQLDGSIPSIYALEKIAPEVKRQLPILFDSGIRSGADIFKAIAIGADAVLIGRPYVFGLAIDGAKGVEMMINNLRCELGITMALSGCRSIAEINNAFIDR